MNLKYDEMLSNLAFNCNLRLYSTFDKYALHGGCPVVKGEKWVATKWVRDKSFGGH